MPEDVVQIGLDAIHRRMEWTVGSQSDKKKDDELIALFHDFYTKEFASKRVIADFAFFIGIAIARLGILCVDGKEKLDKMRQKDAN